MPFDQAPQRPEPQPETDPVASLLKTARSLIEKGWERNGWSSDDTGQCYGLNDTVTIGSGVITGYCALGALYRAGYVSGHVGDHDIGGDECFAAARHELAASAQHLGDGVSIIAYNAFSDQKGVLKLYDGAIERRAGVKSKPVGPIARVRACLRA